MVRAGKIGVMLALLAQGLAADDWAGPKVMTVFSEDGSRFVRVEPGQNLGASVGFAGAKTGPNARALFYKRRADRSFRLTADVALVNPIAPVNLLLTNGGYLITFDNWHNLGYGRAVAIYGPTGTAIASWGLEQLYTPGQLSSIKRSVSSRWWRCSPFHFVDLREQTKVYVRESLGGYFVFELPTGKFRYFEGTAECQPAHPVSAAPSD